jgi:Ku70/Ku80 beta-barrel domain
VPTGRAFCAFPSCPAPSCCYPATSDAEKIRFNQINKATGHRIKIQKVDAETGEPVEAEEIVKGYKSGEGYLEITDDDLEAIEVESARTIDIDQFVPRPTIRPAITTINLMAGMVGAPRLESRSERFERRASRASKSLRYARIRIPSAGVDMLRRRHIFVAYSVLHKCGRSLAGAGDHRVVTGRAESCRAWASY